MPEGLGDHRLPDADSDGERLQHLRQKLPCEIAVTSPVHPLCGERLSALSFRRRGGELLLVVVLPDGTPGTVPAESTDVFGRRSILEDVSATVLSVAGVRQFRLLLARHPATARSGGGRSRAKLWKAVRHAHGMDPFDHLVQVCSAHTTEAAAGRALDRARMSMVRASGYEMAARWSWSVVADPAGVLVDPAGCGGGGS
jgi:hypothetical protein